MLLELYEKGNEAEWLRSFHFHVDVQVRYCETDASGHVSNVAYPVWFELSRLKYLDAVGDPDQDRAYSFFHVLAEFRIRYVAECFYDENLRLHSRMAALGRTSFTMDQALVGADGSIRTVARAFAVHHDGERSNAWSPAQRAAMERFEGRVLPHR